MSTVLRLLDENPVILEEKIVEDDFVEDLQTLQNRKNKFLASIKGTHTHHEH